MKSCYIAFSIHGSNCFIIASKDLEDEAYNALIKTGKFFPVTSRLPTFRRVGTKLGWTRLNTKDGAPLKSVPLILSRFNELAKDGWTVDKTKFVEKHYRGKYTRPVSR